MISSIELAARFAEYIIDALGGETLDKVNEWNASHRGSRCCATHSYCDPNQLMIWAIEDLGGELDVQDADQAALIDGAWTLASVCEFNPETIRNCVRR